MHRIDPAELTSRVDSPLYVGDAWWEPNGGILNPAKLAWSWRDAGAEVFEGTPVSSVARTDSRTELTTPSGRVRTRKVVFTTNAWSTGFRALSTR